MGWLRALWGQWPCWGGGFSWQQSQLGKPVYLSTCVARLVVRMVDKTWEPCTIRYHNALYGKGWGANGSGRAGVVIVLQPDGGVECMRMSGDGATMAGRMSGASVDPIADAASTCIFEPAGVPGVCTCTCIAMHEPCISVPPNGLAHNMTVVINVPTHFPAFYVLDRQLAWKMPGPTVLNSFAWLIITTTSCHVPVPSNRNRLYIDWGVLYCWLVVT